MILFDLDDYCDDERSDQDFLRLEGLVAEIPRLKVTLFTIPGRCSPRWVEKQKEIPWIELAIHGWHHKSNYECASWTKADCKAALRAAREMGLTTRGFKAPGWQISDGCYQALLEEGYWIADQHYNDARRPGGLKAYCLETSGQAAISKLTGEANGFRQYVCVGFATQLHGHLGNLNGRNENALEIIAPQILAAAEQDTDFRFISEVME